MDWAKPRARFSAYVRYSAFISPGISVVNQGGGKMGLPSLTVSPTIQQVLAGQDPVLAKALSYEPPAP
jgi:hypothetical protein